MAGRPRSVSDEAIFDAVTDLVTTVGPTRLTLASIADRVGISAPALTQRFGSKRGLLLAHADRVGVGVSDVFDAARTGTSDPLAALSEALVRMTAPVATREALANSVAALHLDLTDPELGAHAVKHGRSLRRRIAELLGEAAEAGLLIDVDIDRLSDTVYTTYNGAIVTWAIGGSGTLAGWLTDRIERVVAPYRPSPPAASSSQRTG